ncbi:MAG: fimbrillin family protein [Mediterranea sp.]|nr:fimbrillin family protein [Mediterranea sp.]
MKRKKVFHLLLLCAMASVGLSACDKNDSDNALPIPDQDGIVTLTIPVDNSWPENTLSRSDAQPAHTTCDLGNGYQLESTLTEGQATSYTRGYLDGKFADGTLILVIFFANDDNTNKPIGYELADVKNSSFLLKFKSTGTYKLLFISTNEDYISWNNDGEVKALSYYFGCQVSGLDKNTYYELDDTASLPTRVDSDVYIQHALSDYVYASLTDVSASNTTALSVNFKHICTRIKLNMIPNSAKDETISGSGSIYIGPTWPLRGIVTANLAAYCFDSSSSIAVADIYEIDSSWPYDEPLREAGYYTYIMPKGGDLAYLYINGLTISNSTTGKKTTVWERTIPLLDSDGKQFCLESGKSYSLTFKLTTGSGTPLTGPSVSDYGDGGEGGGDLNVPL